MERVLLVNTNIEKGPYPVPPVGLCMLASALEDRYEVKVYDGVFDEGRSLPGLVKEFQPAVVGFGIRNIDDVVRGKTTVYAPGILEKFIVPVREVTAVPFILGGSGFSIFPSELMALTGAEYGITGEAVGWLPLLIDRILTGKGVSGIPNLFTRSAGTSGKPNMGPPVQVSRRFPEIDRWIDFGPYRAKGVYSIQTKRGCAHQCIYCTYPWIEGRSFRPRLATEVADEIEQACERLGDVTFEFVDSTFNDPAGHAEAICRELIRRRLRVRLRTMGINPRHSSAELFGLMMEAGFRQIDATPDSASPRMLHNLGKGFDLASVEKMAELIRKFDLPTMWFFLFGGPGEDEETFGETLRFIDRWVNPLDLVFMNSGIRIYPDTPLARVAEREGQVRRGESLFHPPRFYTPHGISLDRLDELIVKASREHSNCIPSWESTPPADMMAEAIEMRKGTMSAEPMFRTLLRIRRKRMQEGEI